MKWAMRGNREVGTCQLPRTATREMETPTDLPREPVEEVAREDSLGRAMANGTSGGPEQ